MIDWSLIKPPETKFDWSLIKPPKEKEFNEIEFQKVYKAMSIKQGLSLDPNDPKHYYDYRALYRDTGKLEPDETGHFPSKYKLKGHPRMIIGGINTKTGKSIKEEEEKLFDWATIKPPTEEPEFKLEKAPEVKETIWEKAKGLFEAKPEAQIAKAQVSYNISQKTGIPVLEVEKNLPKITKDLGIRGIPTSEEFLTAMFAFPIVAGLIAHPLTTGIGVTKFMALTEAENYAISKLKKWEYKFGAGVGLKELLPEETSRLTKDLVDVADFVGKGYIIAKTDPKIMKIWKSFTQKISTEYTMPKNVYVSAEKVKSIFRTLPPHKLSAEELQLITDLGLNASQYKSAIKKGIDIEIPASKITTITDRPYWAKLKGLFNIKPISKTVMTRGGKVSPAKLMIEGKARVPEVPIVKPEIKPEIPTVKIKPKFKPKIEPEIKPKVPIMPELEMPKDEISQLATGREKMRVPIRSKTDWMEALGKGKYMQIFRDDPNLNSPDAVATSLGISENQLREQIVERIRYKPEKLISPEGLVTGYAGSVFIPSMAEVQTVGTKIISKLSIEAPFIKAGAKETGFQVKNYFGNIGLSHEQGLKEINTMNRFNFKQVTVKESGFKASGEIDYTDITYLSETPGYFARLTPEEKEFVSPAKKSYKDFTDMWFKKINEIGWLEEPFPKSLVIRNNRTIGNLKLSLPRLKTDEARSKVLAEIERLQGQVDRIRKQNIQFVSIPAKTILARADTDPILRGKIMSILPHWGRTTITVKDLVDTGIITRQEADIRVIIGEYCDRMGRKYALGKIFENAEKEGLIKSAAEKPDWPTARIMVKGQRVSIPQLRGKRLDPFFSDVITDFFGREQVTLGGVLGVVKMMQFYNPLFLPMYDVWQSAAAGMAVTAKAPKYMLQGIKDVWLKTDNWVRASENATFSKPFVIPYDKFEYKFKEAMKANKLGDFIKKAALPTNWLPMLYSASWNTAWKLDETVRMMTFNMLQDQGYSDREAGQLAALYHSDYASVPPRTRKMLNKVFFTPTFKITMGKLYLNMLKGAGKCMAKYPAKLVGKEIKVSKEEKNLARGAVIASSIMVGIKLYFESQGYEEVEKFRKYIKTVETDEGPKENVITLANPFNIPWRYYYRVKGAFKPQTINVAEKILQTVKWDLHPIWRVSADIVDNYNGTIYNPFDDSKKIATDIGFYATGEFVAITKGLLESAREGEIKAEAFKALQKDLGKFEAIILKPFIFNYLREPKEKRRAWAIQKLQKEFRLMMLREPSKDMKENYERLQNFQKRLQEIMTDFQ